MALDNSSALTWLAANSQAILPSMFGNLGEIFIAGDPEFQYLRSLMHIP